MAKYINSNWEIPERITRRLSQLFDTISKSLEKINCDFVECYERNKIDFLMFLLADIYSFDKEKVVYNTQANVRNILDELLPEVSGKKLINIVEDYIIEEDTNGVKHISFILQLYVTDDYKHLILYEQKNPTENDKEDESYGYMKVQAYTFKTELLDRDNGKREVSQFIDAVIAYVSGIAYLSELEDKFINNCEINQKAIEDYVLYSLYACQSDLNLGVSALDKELSERKRKKGEGDITDCLYEFGNKKIEVFTKAHIYFFNNLGFDIVVPRILGIVTKMTTYIIGEDLVDEYVNKKLIEKQGYELKLPEFDWIHGFMSIEIITTDKDGTYIGTKALFNLPCSIKFITQSMAWYLPISEDDLERLIVKRKLLSYINLLTEHL